MALLRTAIYAPGVGLVKDRGLALVAHRSVSSKEVLALLHAR
jgi:hypothetical protein